MFTPHTPTLGAVPKSTHVQQRTLNGWISFGTAVTKEELLSMLQGLVLTEDSCAATDLPCVQKMEGCSVGYSPSGKKLRQVS